MILFGTNRHHNSLTFLYILDIGTKGNKNDYFSTIESGNNIIKQVQENWPKHFNEDISFDTVTSGFKNIKKVAPSVYQQFNHFKLLHRRTVHNKLLFKMGISETPNCPFCNHIVESIEHAYIECENVKGLWKATENKVRLIYDSHFKIADIEKIFGDIDNDQVKQVIIICVRDVIYHKKKNRL